MFPLLRSSLVLFLGVILLVSSPLYAEEPPLPRLPLPNTDKAELKVLKGLFTGTKTSPPQADSVETAVQTADQDVQLPDLIPPSKTVKQASASFSTHPLSSTKSRLPEESFDKQESEPPSDNKEEDAPNAMLDKRLFSKKSVQESEEGNIEESEEKSGWTNKLVKPELTPVLSIGGSLLIVVAAFFLLVVLFRKVSPQGNRPLPREAFECLGKYFLTQKHQLQVLRMGNRIVLVSVMPDKVSTLAEITDPDEAVAFLGLCRRLDTNSATEMFRKTIANMSEEELSRPHHRPAVTSRRQGQSAASLDLYSDPDESLASLLARGRHYGR